MSDNRIVTTTAQSPEEERLLQSLRPTSFSQFIGQNQLKRRLEIALKSAKIRNQPVDHILLTGPPGLGKTTLANLVARDMGADFVTMNGAAVEQGADILGVLTSLLPNTILFIDEVHRIPRTLQELLYSAMEDFRVDFILRTGVDVKAYPVPLQPFTLVGATTRKGSLSDPFRERFGLDLVVTFYSVEELAQIVRRSALILGVQCTEQAALEVARRARGTPRIANRLLKRVRDFSLAEGGGSKIDGMTVECSMALEGIDEYGLDELDHQYMRTLRNKRRPVGVDAIAASMQQESSTLTDTVEPYLLYSGYVERESRGRVLTARGQAIA